MTEKSEGKAVPRSRDTSRILLNI